MRIRIDDMISLKCICAIRNFCIKVKYGLDLNFAVTIVQKNGKYLMCDVISIGNLAKKFEKLRPSVVVLFILRDVEIWACLFTEFAVYLLNFLKLLKT